MYYMIPWICNLEYVNMYRDRKQVSSWLGTRVAAGGRDCYKIGDDDYTLNYFDCGDTFTDIHQN